MIIEATIKKKSTLAATLKAVAGTIKDIKLQSKTVTPTEEQQVVTFDDGYDGLAAVTVEAAELGGLTEEEAQAMVDEAIANLKLQTKTVAPTEEQQTITADEGYFGLASVIVEAAEAGGIPENARLYYVGNAVSELDMGAVSFESSAVGALQEG